VLYKALEENAREADRTGTPCTARKRKGPVQCPHPVPDGNGSGARVEKYKRRHWAAYDADGLLPLHRSERSESYLGRTQCPALV
jgi:hypothetical protein